VLAFVEVLQLQHRELTTFDNEWMFGTPLDVSSSDTFDCRGRIAENGKNSTVCELASRLSIFTVARQSVSLASECIFAAEEDRSLQGWYGRRS